MQNGGDFNDLIESFKEIPFGQLLKICKYLNWADKKLHSVFYIEKKDDISEDLLDDFKDDDDKEHFVKPKVLSKTGLIDKSELE